MSSMRRAALFFLPTLLGTAALASTQPLIKGASEKPATSVAAASAQVAAQPAAAAQAYGRAQVPGDINWSIADWRRLRQGGSYSFTDYARFLIYNPGWPGESTMRRNAENAMVGGEQPATVIAFFAQEKPQTARGYARLAESLQASGRHAEAIAAAREAWALSDLLPQDEMSLHARFGAYFTWADHDRRTDALLFDRKAADAQRFLPMTSGARRPVFAARIAMQLRSPQTEAFYRAAHHRISADAGLLMGRLRYMREANNEAAARSLAAQPHAFAERPADPDRWYEMMLLLAQGAADAGQWTTAYNIARQIDDAFAPGTDISQQSYGVRDKYTSLTWLAGSAALRIGRPADAIGAFVRYANGGRSLQVTTKGYYWAGRAALAAGRAAEASSYFQRAGAYPELFYGQLALERLGRSIPAPPPVSAQAVNPAQRTAFHANRLVQATRQLARYGSSSESALFVRALAESLQNHNDRLLALELAQQTGREDLAVWLARAARNNGSPFYVQQAFPRLRARVPGGRIWSLAHGITRQESSFDRAAISHAGARGMMQLMPGTAREQAGKMGLGYDGNRLLTDPNYNVALGSAYFRRLLDRWDGNVPLAVASYNAGAGNVRKWIDRYGDPRNGTDVLTWIEQIPFSETKGYVQRVIENSVVYDQMNPHTPNSTVHVSNFLNKHPPG
jgi:soluble lytic murein transglycosylase